MLFTCRTCNETQNVDFLGSQRNFLCKNCGNTIYTPGTETNTKEESNKVALPVAKKRSPFLKKTKRLLLLSLLGLMTYSWYLWGELPDKQQMIQAAYNIQFIVKKHKSTIEFRQAVYSIPVPLHDMPDYLINALITMEDRSFYNNYGITLMTIARPLKQLINGNRMSGGSTITQQLAKNLFFSMDRSPLRKYKEALLSIKITYLFSKEQILEMYLNRIYFGKGTNGIEAASRKFFSKSTKSLSPFEAAILIGSIPAPEKYNYKKNRRTARKRGQLVIDTMRAIDKFPEKRVSAIVHQGKKRWRSIDYIALLDSIQSAVINKLVGKEGLFTITTTFDPSLQIYAELAVQRYVKRYQKKLHHVNEAGMIALEPSGAIKAMVGSLDRRQSTVNHAVQSERQPGSVFKGIVYCSALEHGWQPDSKLSAARLTIDNWSPRNADHNYPAQVSMQTALVKSINTATVRLMERIGRDNIMELSRRLQTGCRLPDEPGLALGTGECSLLGITKAYVTFANKGVLTQPYSLLGIRDKLGNIIYWHNNLQQKKKQVIKKQNAEVLTKMLQQVVKSGTGKKASLNMVQAAGKTGTTQNNRDAWFIGFTKLLVTGVWVGNRDNSPMKRIYGGNLPAITWRNFMSNAHNNKEYKTQFAIYGFDSETQHRKLQFLQQLDTSKLMAWGSDITKWSEDLMHKIDKLYEL